MAPTSFLPSVSISSIFQPLLGILSQVLDSTPSNLPIMSNYPSLIKHFHNSITTINLSGSISIFHGRLLFCSIFFSSVKFLIELGYLSVCDSYLIENREVCHSIFIYLIYHKLLSCLKMIVTYILLRWINHTYYLYSELNW